jgi:predicted phage terminase large subunit-like protein
MDELKPQSRAQELFLSSPADIVIYGGAAGGGKTWGLLSEPLRHIKNKDFGAVVFRRTFSQITQEGGMWDEASKLYPLFGATSNQQEREWRFPSGARIKFAHMQHEDSKQDYDGAQIALIEFDQLESFTKSQFFYMLSRNRSTSGIRPYIRASCNPMPNWLGDFIGWWIDQVTGLPIPERAGVVRWFVRDGERILWHDYPVQDGKSVTFIPASVYDNKVLMQKDPGYLANLKALDYVEQQRLLVGNWKVVPQGALFRRDQFNIVDSAPADLKWLRTYDLALTTNEASDRTASLCGARGVDACPCHGIVDPLYIRDGFAMKAEYPEVKAAMIQQALVDGRGVRILVETVAFQLAAFQELQRVPELVGYSIVGEKPKGGKIERLRPAQDRAVQGQIHLVRGAWINDFLDEITSITVEMEQEHDDYGDALSALVKNVPEPVRVQRLRQPEAERGYQDAGLRQAYGRG